VIGAVASVISNKIAVTEFQSGAVPSGLFEEAPMRERRSGNETYRFGLKEFSAFRCLARAARVPVGGHRTMVKRTQIFGRKP
jgi:hypothetical protein